METISWIDAFWNNDLVTRCFIAVFPPCNLSYHWQDWFTVNHEADSVETGKQN